MRLTLPLAAVAMLAACSEAPVDNRTTVTNDSGVVLNTTDLVENLSVTGTKSGEPAPAAAPEPAYTPPPPNPPGPVTPGEDEPAVPTPGATPPATSLPEGPFARDSAQGAADVVQTYYALLEAGKYRQAWRLWSDDGRASGMTADAFARSFARYREYHANIGGPSRIEGAAGSRYVTVPVRTWAIQRNGRRVETGGRVTLRRSMVDGATPAQRRWHISAVDLKPRPASVTGSPPRPVRPGDQRPR